MSILPSDEWEVVLDALLQAPSGLLTDIDGTISPVAPTPDEARVDPEATEVLESLSTKLAVVGAITGRGTQYAYDMVGVPGMVYAGNHGLEDLLDGEVTLVPEAEPYAGKIAEVFAQARPQVSSPGILWEDKQITGSVHYRQAPDHAAAHEEIVSVLAPLISGAGLVLHEGRMIVEIRPAIGLNKGAAVRRLIGRYGLRGVVFLGDDVTDTDAFRVLRELRTSSEVSAVCVGVLSTETPPAVLELADVTVHGVPGVVELLKWLDRNL